METLMEILVNLICVAGFVIIMIWFCGGMDSVATYERNQEIREKYIYHCIKSGRSYADCDFLCKTECNLEGK